MTVLNLEALHMNVGHLANMYMNVINYVTISLL